ncbi:MAG: hypothetical protein K0Q95_2030 [Bacteroidota bacterium]|jgi:hypothetical protein|nr:hypothetical protein [Bacteroidota bacterium]
MRIKKSPIIIVLALASVAGAFSVYSHQQKNSMLCFSAKSTYEAEWRKVDSLEKKGLTKSALEIVGSIYSKAKSDDNASQLIKAIIYRMKFEQQMEEFSMESSISKLEQETSKADYPEKQILHSILAETYWQYYQNNRWRFHNRTTTVNFDMEDVSTWDLKAIFNATIKNYQASLQNSDSLKKTSISLFDAILEKNANARSFRPTLFDFLAHRAVDFYMNEEPDVTRPAYKFELSSESYFWNSKEFSRIKIESKDTLSLKFFAVKALQELTDFHLNDSDPQALIDVDLKRLQFVKNKSVSEYKDSLYLKALLDLEKSFSTNKASSEVSAKIANVYFEKASKYNPLQSDENKWMKKLAKEVCETAIKKFHDSEGALDCKALLARIKEHSLDFVTEKAELPSTPGRALVTYKNVKKAYVRIAEMDIDRYNKSVERFYGEELIKQYLKLKPVKTFSVELPDDGDYQLHSTEIKIPALDLGHYLILIGTDSAFSYKANAIAYAATWITNISYVSRRMEDGSFDFYVQHRASGEPLKAVTAQLYYQRYNYTSRKYESIRSEKYTSDEKGFFNVPPVDDYRNFNVEFNYKTGVGPAFEEDRLQTDNGIYQYKSYKEEKKKYIKTFFFLDRGIYRPGQTIYFKGIMISTDGEGNAIMPNESSNVVFYDVNSQKVADVNLTTNEYGTFSGSFTAPEVLNGQMTITNGSGTAYFSVEDYKRPKFEVSFKPVEGNYRLNENIKLMGNAVAYSAAAIDGAEVKYRVVRNASFPFWWYCWRGYYPSSPQMEILNGITATNDTGSFFIDFKAIADPSIPKSSQPTFTYTIYADVTDINGETHSSQTYVNAAYTALNLNIEIPQLVEKSINSSFPIITTNMSGQFQEATGNIEIYKLKEPEKIYRSRLWAQPDKFITSKEEFASLFPNDEYKDESNMYKWEKGAKVYQQRFNNKRQASGSPAIYDSVRITDLKNWKAGIYVLESRSKDVFGEEVKDVKYFTVYASDDNSVPANSISWFSNLSTLPVEPGETAKFVIGSREANVKVLYEIEHQGQIIKSEYISLNNEKKLISIPVEEKYRGNFSFHLLFIKNNRSYESSGVVTVPYTNKELDIQFETFRNKLLPGQQEEWKIKIKDKKGDKVAAEMIAAVYDASLDAFRPNNWYVDIYNSYYSNLYWDANSSFGSVNAQLFQLDWNKYPVGKYRYYDRLNWFGYQNRNEHQYMSSKMRTINGVMSVAAQSAPDMEGTLEEKSVDENNNKDKTKSGKKESSKNTEALDSTGDIVTLATGATMTSESDKKDEKDLSQVAARSNFAETAFFYPQLETDKDGGVIIKFTIPEALTKWRMMGFAHTKDLKYGSVQKELQTQKDLMVIPNAPRFFRENDKIQFSTKISNLSDKDLTGTAQLFLYDAITMKEITSQLTSSAQLDFGKGEVLRKGRSTSLSWDLSIPERIGAITYKVVAQAGNFTDGEEMAVPVLTNKMLVTESMPLPVRGAKPQSFNFDKLISQSNGSTTLRNHKLTLEFTSNPAWYAIQSLPYLMEYPYECSEQTFSRYYANSIASHIANSSPKIKAVFDSWTVKNSSENGSDSKALLSGLEKNQELKSLMLQETPWVLDAKDETERKKRVALLFDLNKMGNEMGKALKKLQKSQTSNGGWPWFDGMPDDRYITQHIITGMSHLDRLGIKNIVENKSVWNMISQGVHYLDQRIKEDYEWILKHDAAHINDNHLSPIQIQYLYARSYFKEIAMSNGSHKAFEYYKGQAEKYWLANSRYMQGMIALALNRYNETKAAAGIMKSLKENALHSEEMGMYWASNTANNYEGYYWYQSGIESQALLIEAFDEVAHDEQSVEELKVWLLKSKQTQNWKTTKATAEACYALLLKGTDWLSTESNVEIQLGDVKVNPKELPDFKPEAGTGYFKTSWTGSEVKPSMGNVTVTKTSDGVSWGSLYWQYFEQLDKITPAKTPLVLKKQLFLQKNTDAGPVIEPITEKTTLKVGDKLKVRIEIRVDRDMEYVHMKDMRASGLEPVNVISGYRYQDGLGYYESTRDAATNFFFSYLPKGSYVFEYPLLVSHKGNFSNGITSIGCMYAPEFTSHSEGIRINVNK